jgi:hypothetical protein
MAPLTDTPIIIPDRDLERDRDPSGPRIRCPLCGWSPRKEDKWFCNCGHEWNTFDTGAVCPPAYINGLKRNASRAVGGRRIRIGMRSKGGNLRPALRPALEECIDG